MNPELTGLRRIESTLETLEVEGISRPNNESNPCESSFPSFSIQVNPPAPLPEKIRALDLPKLPLAIGSDRYTVDPAFALDILQDIGATIARWQAELARAIDEIQLLYEEGPLVDGWLESHTDCETPNFSAPSQTQGESRRNYVESLDDRGVSYQTPRPGYRLCGIDESGRFWSQDCPKEDVAEVSLAIGRYQKLQQLLTRKQNLETRLEGITETLILMRSSMDYV
ncbi:hypothetical protein [Oscillatoria sp. FACHB-1406]|uniref:hypothetical protein n=1 Tax=Oscillatoria sp. FACHB-1406 TaxID=2692846 RepID=UPI001688CA98|nr:hypothetical protein [Oscillatoria sp. FACHB-1406]MBD2580601.1 hypothetical protein [Oscillatoria sp. FACHB-1406]